ncbi:MAG TPA: bifunctional DNA-formamidopyrimidine glycosylase/DNA-(apurinic or apyrimidinic site) lyase [Candidatus Saccharimonadales bacterium]|nr:bifunctional DNA-formamidopyrimidine glycosylase/DNA-(apurinic or apyrimidinic site) lyase [Candidatus Saccharimonadales bacterium]
MPELPEVETVKIGLQKYLIGHKITDVKIKTSKLFTGDLKNLIEGKIVEVRRFAKVLSIDLSNGYSIVIHIKLTGQLIYRGANLKTPGDLSKKVVGGIGGNHTHVIFELDRNGFLYYNDIRRFGWLKIIKTDEVANSGFVGKLGPEPFKDLTDEKFKEILGKSKTAVKVLLMNQEKIGGIGNIYANDALLLSKIHPKRASNSLTPTEKETLYNNVLKVLKKGIETGGASELSFVTAAGGEGKYQQHFIAYGQQGKVCQICGKEKIKKFTLGGRGTYFCPHCQQL